jgi:hypothetical protein
MDPNAALKEIRAILDSALDGDRQDAFRVCELVEGLDGWISHGGFFVCVSRIVDGKFEVQIEGSVRVQA